MTLTDELDAFLRRSPAGGKAAAAHVASVGLSPAQVLEMPSHYQAWGKLHPENPLMTMLDIRTKPEKGVRQAGELMPLHHLLRVVYTLGDHGDVVSLAFGDSIVTLKGDSLTDIKADLIGGKVDYIEQFDSSRWPEPPPGTPVIRSIDFLDRRTVVGPRV